MKREGWGEDVPGCADWVYNGRVRREEQGDDERVDEQPRVVVTILNTVARGAARAEAEPPRVERREWVAGVATSERGE